MYRDTLFSSDYWIKYIFSCCFLTVCLLKYARHARSDLTVYGLKVASKKKMKDQNAYNVFI